MIDPDHRAIRRRPSHWQHWRVRHALGDGRVYALVSWFFVGLVILSLAYLAFDRYQAFHRLEDVEARRSAQFAIQAVGARIEEQRRLLKLFTRLHAGLIQSLLTAPNNAHGYQRLHAAVIEFFPDAFAFTLADRDGRAIIDDFDGLMGEVCQKNIQHFAAHREGQRIFIHPHPEVYHYDQMVHVGEHIFFVSFRPDAIVRVLAENAYLGQELLLLKRGGRLIEVTAQGTRNRLQRDFHLSRAEEDAILFQAPVAGTEWLATALPIADAVTSQERGIIRNFAASAALVLGLAGILHFIIRHELGQRLRAEAHALEMTKLGYSDALTGLPNRRALDEAIEREWLWMEHTGEPLAVMMVDVDYFKRYNDALGHIEGDRCLRLVADALRHTLNRPRDNVGRYGGEEFLVLLPNSPCTSAWHLAEAMHQAIAGMQLPHPDSAIAPCITVSIGLVCGEPGLTATPQALLRLADEALYRAKGAGRNTTISMPPMVA